MNNRTRMKPERIHEAARGALLGLAVGDALGVPVEGSRREVRREDPIREMRAYGRHHQPAGTWSDDTSMTICLMHSLIEKGIDCTDQMRRYADWALDHQYTARGEAFDTGTTTYHAIMCHLDGLPATLCGGADDRDCGNGSLMRTMPIGFYLRTKYRRRVLEPQAAKVIHKVSDVTHAHPRCEMACGIYCSVLFRLLDGGDLLEAVTEGIESALAFYREQRAFAEVLADFETLPAVYTWTEDQIDSGGYVLSTLQAALWCLLTTDSYTECVLQAVNLGRDTDTTAAVAGALAGLWYGADEIPEEWLKALAKCDELTALAERFAEACVNESSNRQ